MADASQVFFSNSSQVLLRILQSQLDQSQKTPPRSRVVIITPNQLVKKNLQKKLLDISPSGVVTGILFLEFAPAIIKLFRSVLGRDPRIPSKGFLSLQLEKILEGYERDEKVLRYLSQNPSIRIPPFAEQLAGLFLEYGKSAKLDSDFFTTWQGQLFQEVFSKSDYPSSLVELPFHIPKVTHSLHFYGFNSIPPVYHRLIKRLEAYFDINIYQLLPTPEYFGDQTRFSGNHPLLQNYGILHRKAADAFTDFGYETSEVFLKNTGEGTLDRIRESVAKVEAQPIEVDESLSLHGTPSLGRGIEIAYQMIAEKVLRNEASPDDFLLLFNDIEEALPDIHRTFGSIEAPLPYQIYDIPAGVTDSIFSTFHHVLSLIMGRVTFDELTLLLEKKEIQENFELSLSDVHQVIDWLKRLHFRWGLSETHRSYFLPNQEPLGSLETTLHTLAYSFMKPQRKDSNDPNAFSPFSIETVDLPLIEMLSTIKDVLERFSHWFHTNKTFPLGVWKQEIFQLITTLFDRSDYAEQLYRFCESLFEYVEGEYSAKSVLRYIENGLSKKKGIYGASTLNGVIFAPLHPDNVLSKKYIFLFGLDEGRFPKEETENILELDSIHLEYSPTRAHEGAATLLNALLCAETQVFLQYTSRNSEDGKPQEPSQLLEPLGLIAQNHASVHFQERHVYQLQSAHKMTLAHSLPIQQHVFDPSFYAPVLPELDLQPQWDISVLRQFLNHPLRAYTQHTLGMYLERDEGEYEEREFTLNTLDRYILRREGRIDHVEALGGLPTGGLKKWHKSQLLEEAEETKKLLELYNVKQLYTVHFREDSRWEKVVHESLMISPSIHVKPYVFQGYLPNVSDEQLVIFDTPSNAFKYWSDILIFAAWKQKGSLFFIENGTQYDLPKEGLKELLTYIQFAQSVPSPLLPSFFTAFFEGDEAALLKKVKQELNGFFFEDPYLSRYFSTVDIRVLIDKWQSVVVSSFTPFTEWVSHARV